MKKCLIENRTIKRLIVRSVKKTLTTAEGACFYNSILVDKQLFVHHILVKVGQKETFRINFH